MIYLVELEALDGAGEAVTLRYSDAGLTTLPTDTPPNAHYRPRVSDPGNIERHLFSDGRTFGDVSVGAGDVRLKNVDGALDYLRSFAFDGRAIRIWSMKTKRSPFASRVLRLEGTTAQTEFQDSDFVITVRDWLEALRQPLQALTYKGTTISSGLPEAEGEADLKDKKKAMLFGLRRNVPPVLVDPYELIYEISAEPIASVTAVRDRGVPLDATGDHATLAALKAAVLTAGQYATCLTLGLIRLGGLAFGLVTADAAEGTTPADRTAGQIARRMLVKAGMFEGEDFFLADISTLDAIAPQECGVWYGAGSTVDSLSAISFVLGSVGGSISPDFAGVYRIRRLVSPTLEPDLPIVDEGKIIGPGDDTDRDAPGDQSDGLPAKKVTVRYAQNLAVSSVSDVDAVNTTPEYRSFASQEWRQASVSSDATAARHLLAHEMTFDTALCHAADAEAEAARRLALYSVPREVFRVTLPAEKAEDRDLSDTVLLKAKRYGLEEGRALVVIGVTDEFEPGHTTLTLWG